MVLRAVTVLFLLCLLNLERRYGYVVMRSIRMRRTSADSRTGGSLSRCNTVCSSAQQHTTEEGTVVNRVDMETSISPPRLYADEESLLHWILEHGGDIRAQIRVGSKGWYLITADATAPGVDIFRIPKRLCISSDPIIMSGRLLESTVHLMQSLLPSQWRLRLALALLSERVRPDSFYTPYIQNLPFEFWGMPIFYTAEEHRLTQDPSILENSHSRSRFLSEFSSSVLAPLHRTAHDPLSGHKADVHALAWGFAAACSRALRNPLSGPTLRGSKSGVIDTTCLEASVGAAGWNATSFANRPGADGGLALLSPTTIGSQQEGWSPVLVPLLDLASHSFSPNCEVVATDGAYLLRTLRPLKAGEELTINYGAFSNMQLLQDFGFTVDDNPHDTLTLPGSGRALEEAVRVVGGTGLSSTTRLSDAAMPQWKRVWLQCLGLPSVEKSHSFKVARSTSRQRWQLEPRLQCALRVLHTRREGDLLRKGYDPFLLQEEGCALSPVEEARVLGSAVNLAAQAVRDTGSDLAADIALLKEDDTGAHFSSAGWTTAPSTGSLSLADPQREQGVEQCERDCAQILRNILTSSFAALPVTTQTACSGGESVSGQGKPLSQRKEIALTEDLQQCGQQHPPNSREALRARIRRKHSLSQLVLQLAEQYEMLREEAYKAGQKVPALLDLLGGGEDKAVEVEGGAVGGLQLASEGMSRAAKIRLLLGQAGQGEEVRSEGVGVGTAAMQRARAFATKWAEDL